MATVLGSLLDIELQLPNLSPAEAQPPECILERLCCVPSAPHLHLERVHSPPLGLGLGSCAPIRARVGQLCTH